MHEPIAEEACMYKHRDYLYAIFIVVIFTATPSGTPHSIELMLRIVAVAWFPAVALLLTPANMWIEAKNECDRLRHGIALPDKWREQARRFAGWGSGRTILACREYPIGNESDRHWSTFLPSNDDRIEFELTVKEAGLRLHFSQYIKAKHPICCYKPDDFVRWCEFAFASLPVPYREGFTTTSIEKGISYEKKEHC